MILGRDFLTEGKLTLVYTPLSQGEHVDLFASLPLCIEEHPDDDLEQILNNNTLNLDLEVVQRLRSLLFDVNKETKEIVYNNHTVRVNLKNTSIYAFASRYFAHIERIQIREISDTLLKRGIIKPSMLVDIRFSNVKFIEFSI